MNYLSAEGLSKSYSETPLFEGLSISLQKGQKMALIAANGSGKSTLLRILAGYETPDNGVVSVRNDITTGYLEQDPRLAPDVAVIDAILESSHPAAQILAEYEKLVARGAGAEEEKMHAVIEKMDALNAWDYEARAREILSRLGITDVEQAAKNLSGGQKKRVALARLLLQEPDLLLMDEPTNHLDLDMIEWLERYLINLNKTLLVVSHDRYFVDGVCNTITEMNNGKLFTYKGNYAYFLQKKEEREFREGREIDKARNLLRTELEWMRRQPQARGTKQKARIDSFYDLDEKANSQKADQKLKITMQMGRLGSKILEFENICKSYGEKTLIKDFSHVFRKGEKAGIVGANGTGKSTLLNMIMGSVKPDQGRIKTGETVSFGYFSQEVAKVDPGKKVIDVVKDITEYVETGDGNWMNVTQFLNHFLFKGSKQYTQVSKLSGGELKRLQLLTVLLKNPNFLILDEPTNDLDITTLNILEEFLSDYAGCMLLVTHDRYFMDRLVDHVFVLDGTGTIRDIHGNYSAYRQMDKKSPSTAVQKEIPAQAKPPKERKQKRSYKEQKEFESLESSINVLEQRKTELEAILSGSTSNPEIVQKAVEEYAQVEADIHTQTARWLELADIATQS